MAISDQDMLTDLARAGVEFFGWDDTLIRVPVVVAGLAPACTAADGRVDASGDEVVHVEVSDAADRLNVGWYRLATESGLFNADHEFLLGVVDYDHATDVATYRWARARLGGRWDIAGSGSGRLISDGRFAEFTALSLDNRVIVRMTLWGDNTASSLAVIEPDQAGPLRRYAEHMTTDPFRAAQRDTTLRWLEAYPQR